MKHLLLFSLFFLLISCSSDSDAPEVSNKITPPAWIQGTWGQITTTNPVATTPFATFKVNDFCLIASTIEICNAANLQQLAQSGATVNVAQTITNNEYTLSMTIQSQTTTYKFIKISNTEIEYVNPTNGLPNLSLIKE